MSNLATAYGGLGEHKRAMQLKTECLETREKVLGADHPDVIKSIASLAT